MFAGRTWTSRNAALTLVFGALLATACSRDSRVETAQPAAGSESEWTQTPLIQSVVRTGAALQVTGTTAPQGRVVLRGLDGPAYATSADATGRFSLTIDVPAADVLFDVEARRGEVVALAPFRMLVSRDPQAPVALLAEGAPSRRLAGGGLLDAVDSDGRAVLASGRGAPEAVVDVTLGGARPVRTRTDAEGRWSAVLTGEGAGAAAITVGGRTYNYPGPGAGLAAEDGKPDTVTLEPIGQGWRVGWRLPSSAWQSAWFPND